MLNETKLKEFLNSVAVKFVNDGNWSKIMIEKVDEIFESRLTQSQSVEGCLRGEEE